MGLCETQYGSVYYPPCLYLSLVRRYPERLCPPRSHLAPIALATPRAVVAGPMQQARLSLVLAGRFLRPSLPSFGCPPGPRRGLHPHPLCYIPPPLASPLAANGLSHFVHISVV